MKPETIVLSIGRTFDGKKILDTGAWFAFRREVDAIACSLGDVVFWGSGIGIYNGTSEESYSVIVSTRENLDADSVRVARETLAKLATHYHQESIAWTEGHTQFILGGDS